MFPIIGFLAGVILALLINFNVPPTYTVYLAMAILAALDSVFGAIVSTIKNTFKLSIFVTGFFGNAFIAAALTFIGNSLGMDFSLAAIVVFGSRMFSNFATIRRIFIYNINAKTETE
ncbi:MAG: small basic family protein [Clostridia bacterium]|nr:small basic family protein [Clostridia bacterium]